MLEEKNELSLKLVLKWHKILFDNVDIEIAGVIRKHPIGIYGSKFEPCLPIELDFLLNEFFTWYNKN